MTIQTEEGTPTSSVVAETVGKSLRVRDLRIAYGETEAVKGISFDVEPGGFLTLLGPSGCGKTTTLRCIAGLESASSGTIRIGETLVAGPKTHVQPEKRGINMVFQSYAVWPHMTVAKNVGYGLKGTTKSEAKARVDEVLELVGLSKFASRYGTELSGGQQQRVALARAIVTRPKVLLFDEPLSNLDAGLREQMRFEILELQRAVGITSIYVTHDQTEAMSMSDKIVLLNDGVVQQDDLPRELYRRPRTEFAANFVGRANMIPGTLTARRDALDVLGFPMAIAGAERADEFTSPTATVVFRAENVRIGLAAKAAENSWPATVIRSGYLGRTLDVHFQIGEHVIRAELSPDEPIQPGQTMTIGVQAADVHFVPHFEG